MTAIDGASTARALPEGGSRAGSTVHAFPPRQVLAGVVLILALVGAVTAWSLLAPLEGAVVSPGIVSVAGFRKQVQHLEGGIVESILVRDGDHVRAGQLLVKLRDVQPAAELRQLERQYFETQAAVARLLAERDNSTEVAFAEELIARADDPLVQSVMAGQQSLLESRRALHRDTQSVLEQRIAQAREEINGLAAQIEAKRRQRSLTAEELASIEKALERKLVPKSTALQLQRQLAGIDGELSAYRAEQGRLEQNVLEMRQHMSEIHAQQIAQITEQLREERARLFELSQKIVAARDVLRRTQIVAPIDGIVVNLQIHTQDGVIGAGEPILEVVPTDDELVVHAFVAPEDIDEVRAGMAADVRLTSVSRRNRVPLAGVVADISADRLSDPQSGEEYYRARIELEEGTAPSQVVLVAGMGADVFIRTGARTPLDYLVAPLAKSLQLGLREN